MNAEDTIKKVIFLCIGVILLCSCTEADRQTTEVPGYLPPPAPPEALVKEFLPLTVGNKWNYHYYYSGFNSGYGRIFDGEMLWQIARNYERNDSIFYNVVTDFTGIEINVSTRINKSDTTFHDGLAGQFRIVETTYDVEIIEFWFWRSLNGFTDREVRGDTLTLGDIDFAHQRYVKDIGLIQGRSIVGTNSHIDQRLKLLEFELR